MLQTCTVSHSRSRAVVEIRAKPSQRTLVTPRAESIHHTRTPTVSQRAALAAAAWALTTAISGPAFAAPDAAQPTTTAPTTTTSSAVEPVYFGNGCFWGRQKDFVDAEMSMGRLPGNISSVVGYAGGKIQSPKNKVCYYYTNEKETVYEGLGHAEVVQVQLDADQKEEEFRKLAKVYFSQFRQLPGGKMIRQDPQDAGPGYRNVVGIPGGVNSPLFRLLQEANVNKMQLREGNGNQYNEKGRPTEGDELNVVWIVDSDSLPFYRAETYHQYHNGLGKAFPAEYTKDMKAAAEQAGIIAPTGCPELFFMAS